MTPVRASIALLALAAGCSVGVPDGEVLAAQPLPIAPLTIVDDDVVYTDADDEDLELPGLQITVRVDVLDEQVDRVLLRQTVGAELSEPVREDLDGRRVALFLVTLPRAENPVVATAPGLDLEARAVMRAAATASNGR